MLLDDKFNAFSFPADALNLFTSTGISQRSRCIHPLVHLLHVLRTSPMPLLNSSLTFGLHSIRTPVHTTFWQQLLNQPFLIEPSPHTSMACSHDSLGLELPNVNFLFPSPSFHAILPIYLSRFTLLLYYITTFFVSTARYLWAALPMISFYLSLVAMHLATLMYAALARMHQYSDSCVW
jgi:hypothetical protein